MFLRSADKHGREAEHNLDLRIRKTRRAIRSGLVKACQAKPYTHVSVTDICSASMVSRTTRDAMPALSPGISLTCTRAMVRP